MLDDETAAVLATVDRYCREVVEPRVGRPEQVLPLAELTHVETAARDCGILPLPEPGLALWEGVEPQEGLQRSLASLVRLGESSAGVAFHLHQISLAALVGRELGLAPSVRAALLMGRGLARGAVVDALAGRVPGRDGSDLLREALPGAGGGARTFLLHAAGPWETLLSPAWDDAGLSWRGFPGEALPVAGAPGQHGLEEVPMWEVRLPAADSGRELVRGPAARRLLATVLGLSWLGLAAIALGATRHGLALARAHAATRRQGGALLREHAAVQELVGEAEAAVATVASALRGVPAVTGAASLASVLGVRAVAHRLLCEAANASLQVLGGMGYMRDAGAEKIVRDANHLRLLGGTASEAWLFLARAEERP